MTIKKKFIETALPRFQACLECKKRKIRCDAKRPSCGSCARTARARGTVLTACHYQEDTVHSHSNPSSSRSSTRRGATASTSPPPPTFDPPLTYRSSLDSFSVHSPTESHDFYSENSSSHSEGETDLFSGASYDSMSGPSYVNSSESSLDVFVSKDDQVVTLENRVASLETLVALQMNCITALRSEVAYSKAQQRSPLSLVTPPPELDIKPEPSPAQQYPSYSQHDQFSSSSYQPQQSSSPSEFLYATKDWIEQGAYGLDPKTLYSGYT